MLESVTLTEMVPYRTAAVCRQNSSRGVQGGALSQGAAGQAPGKRCCPAGGGEDSGVAGAHLRGGDRGGRDGEGGRYDGQAYRAGEGCGCALGVLTWTVKPAAAALVCAREDSAGGEKVIPSGRVP